MADFHGADVTVEIAFGYTPFDASPVWTDVTADVRSLSFSRGRQYELDQIDGGRMRVVLDNQDGDYNAHNTAGTYYPNVKPMVPIRVTATYSMVTYALWYGFVERWPVSFPAQVDSVVSVECADLFKLLALADGEWVNRESVVTSYSPEAFWRFTDTTDLSGNGHTLTFNGSPTTGVTGNWTNDLAVTFDGTNDRADIAGDEALVDDLINGGAFTVEAWFSPADKVAATLIWAKDVSRTIYGIQFVAATGDFVDLQAKIGTDSKAIGTVAIDTYLHLVTVWEHVGGVSGNEWRVTPWIDGVEGTPVTGEIILANTPVIEIGREIVLDQNYFQGDISEIAIYPVALRSDQIAKLFATTVDPLPDELTSVRIARFLTQAGFTDTDLETGQTIMDGPNTPDSSSVLAALQLAADTESGQFFIAADGTPTFHDRHYRLENQVTPAGTFGPSNLPYVDIVPGFDDELIKNSVTVDPADGTVPFTSEDTASQNSYGVRAHSKTLYLADPDEAQYAADYLTAVYAEPGTRVQALRFRLGGETALWPVILAAELGNRYTVDVPLAGDDLNQDVYLEGIAHTINFDKNWEVTFELSPADSPSFWLLGVEGYSELDETTRLGY